MKAILGLLMLPIIYFLHYWMLTEAFGLEIQNIGAFIFYCFGSMACMIAADAIKDQHHKGDKV